jgi:hypothetical protein
VSSQPVSNAAKCTVSFAFPVAVLNKREKTNEGIAVSDGGIRHVDDDIDRVCR